jgi:RNA polymerase sigma factor (sigma-70 family)
VRGNLRRMCKVGRFGVPEPGSMRTVAAMKAGRDLERLYARHKRDVYRFVLRDVRDPDEAEDITQTAFLDAFRALRRGDEPQQPQAWLLTIAQNAARRRFRTRAARPSEVELDADFLAAPDREGPSAEEIRVALERLRPAQREALVLREIGGRSYVEIAAAMDMSVPAVETLLFRARRALRVELDEEAPRTRRRALGSLVPLPGFGWDGLGSLAGWLSGRAATVKVAGAVSAAVLGTGVGVPQGLVPRGDAGAAKATAPATAPIDRVAPLTVAVAPTPDKVARPARASAKPARADKPQRAPARPQAKAPQTVAAAVNQLSTEVARQTEEVRQQVDGTVARLRATSQQATDYIRKIPKVVSGIGALSAAEIPSAITLRVSTGSTIPSSQRRAVE